MNSIIRIIRAEISRKNSIFVFPSEIATNFWQKQICKYLDLPVIRLNQFISWDQFKKSCLSYPVTAQPVDNRARLLFLNHFFLLNKKQSLLHTIIPPVYAMHSPVFLKKYLEILPGLHKIPGLIKAAGNRFINQAKIDDLLLLKSHYDRFLAVNRLFEPNYLQPLLQTGQQRYFLFFTEITRDYTEYQPLFRDCAAVREIPVPQIAEASRPEIQVFENSLFEIAHVLNTIAGLLDKGLEPGQIAITAGNLPEIEEYLRLQAEILAIPLYIHSGKPVSSYQEILFLKQLKLCYLENFSFIYLRNLLLNQAVPWQNRELGQLLVRFGIRYKCIQGKNGQQDIWLLNFQKAANIKDEFSRELANLQNYYFSLQQSISAICLAEDFSTLHDRVQAFVAAFFKKEIYLQAAYRIFRFALELLTELELTARNLDGLGPVTPFLCWLQYLEEKQYVRESHAWKIAVYPYRVSAGIYPEYHFILNTNQQATQYLVNHYPYLSLDEQAAIADPEKELSGEYLKLYTRSGRHVCFSYTSKSFTGTNIVPGFFIASGKIKTPAADTISAQTGYNREVKFWAGKQNHLPEVYLLQQQSITRAFQTGLGAKCADYTVNRITEVDLHTRILKKLQTDNHLKISPSGLELYTNCAFAFLLTKIADLTQAECQPVLIDNRELGNLMHRIFEDFYTRIKALPGSLISPAQAELYTRLMTTSCDKVLTTYAQTNAIPADICWHYLKNRITASSHAFLAVEMVDFRDFSVLDMEAWLRCTWPEEKILLYGKLDRISADAGRLALVDYKKRSSPGKGEIFSETPGSFQMPFYAYLLEETYHKPVDIAAYYIIDKCKYEYIIHPTAKAMAGRQELSAAVANLKQVIRTTAANLRQGDFRIPAVVTSTTCQHCLFRAVCRNKFPTG